MSAQAEPAHRRLALLIATSDYNDPALRQLRAPGRDASDLAEVLGTPQIGGFAVQTLINARCVELLEAIEEFCADRRPDDQLLIYLSCHGVLDDRGRLYYAATDTRRQRTAATAVAAAWLNERLEDCRARSQIVILDCCHSGAFASGAKGQPDLALEQRFAPIGRGRLVLTASRSTEYSFEGDQASGDGVQSVFTRAIVDGLRTGDADRDKDGLITVTDMYHHVYERVRSAEPRQTPEIWTYGAEGDVLLAYSARGAVPVPLPEDLRVTLESPRPRVRETGVTELAELLDAAQPGMALSARQALQQISDEDIPRVAAIARLALEGPPGTAAREVSRKLVHRSQREWTQLPAHDAFKPSAESLPTVPEPQAAHPSGEDRGQATVQPTAPESASPHGPTARPLLASRPRAGALLALMVHDDMLEAMAFSPDGTRLATASEDETARLWETATGREVARMEHDGAVSSVAFSPDGTRLATASSDKTARLWETATGREVARMEHEDGVWEVAFSPDGTRLATVTDKGKRARLWETATGREVARTEHDGAVPVFARFAFSPDGTQLATCNGRNTARLWDTATGREVARMEHDGGVAAVAFSPDGTRLATGSWDKTARLWETATGREVARMEHDDMVRVFANFALAFSPDGTRLATCNWDKTARLWETATGRAVARMEHDGRVEAMAFSPDGTRLATASSDKTARLWETATGREMARMEHEDGVRTVAFSPDGTRLATTVGEEGKTARLWETATGRQLARMEHEVGVWEVAFSPDGTRLATGSWDRTVRLWTA